MEIRTFRGRELGTVMGLVRNAYGEEAMIVNTRYLSDRSVEVEVAIESTKQETPAPFVRPLVRLTDARLQNEHPAVDLLRSAGVRAPLLAKIETRLSSVRPLQESLTMALAESLQFDSSLAPQRPGDPRVVALVGPTGVGKTTTLAKLAAQLRLAFDIKIAFISADSFRVGAAHQLQSYATLLKIPCRTVCPPGARRVGAAMVESIDEALAEFRGEDLILVDTAGTSARDRERLTLLQESLGEGEQIERILVLQAPSNDRDLADIAESFARLHYSRVIVTKVDESSNLGPVLNLANQLRKPLAFVCGGQRVPEDIEPASAERLAWMLTSRFN